MKTYQKIAAIAFKYPSEFRVYYGLEADFVVLLLVGKINKKRQSADVVKAQDDWDDFRSDINAAERFWIEYLQSQRKE